MENKYNLSSSELEMVRRYVVLMKGKEEMEFNNLPYDALQFEMDKIKRKVEKKGFLKEFAREVKKERLGYYIES